MRPARALGLAAALFAAAPALAQAAVADAAYGEAFVGAFADACVPERLSYAGTRAHAEKLGWTAAERDAHPELAAMMAKMDEGALEAAEEMDGTFDHRLYAMPVAGSPHFLIVSRATFMMEGFSPDDEPDEWAYIGCYLYNFDATAPIDPAPMVALTGNEIAREVVDEGLVSYLFGPPCPMPRTGDSYLTFVAPDSPHVAETGFSGLMVKFDTSEPDPGEDVPDTYCTDTAPSQ